MAANVASGQPVSGLLKESIRPVVPFVLRAAVFCALTASLLGGCYQPTVLPQSEGHIATPAAKPTLADIPPPARVSSLVPEPKPAIKPPTYSVVVNEVPVKELLLALARDTKQNIDIHPGLQGAVSLNAINETLPAILDRVAKQVNMRYRVEGNTIIVLRDDPYVKSYRVNYVNMTRETDSRIGVSGQIAATGGTGGALGGASGTGSTGGAAGINVSQTTVQTKSNNNFWDALRDNIRAILNTTLQQNQTAEAKAERTELYRQEMEVKIRQTEAASRAGAGAPALASTVINSLSAQPQVSLLPDDVVVNPVTGTVTVNATEKQHLLVQQYLDSVVSAAQRQVLIETTIAEVKLSDQFQAGVDWSRLAISGGITFNQSLLAGNLGVPPSFTVGYVNPTSSVGNIAAAIMLLDQFGNTRVLSSPKLMAMNNQTALLKVVDNIVYFEVSSTTLTTANAPTTTSFSSIAHTVPVGVIMSMTPQINENGQVTLTVRPTISRVLSFVNDPNPSLAAAGVISPVPQIQTREMESVLQLVSGQTAILGGLMQNNSQYNRDSVPGAGNPVNTGQLSELFGYRNDLVTKSELIIFLRPTVITTPSLESDELKSFQHLLPQQNETPILTLPSANTGSTK